MLWFSISWFSLLVPNPQILSFWLGLVFHYFLVLFPTSKFFFLCLSNFYKGRNLDALPKPMDTDNLLVMESLLSILTRHLACMVRAAYHPQPTLLSENFGIGTVFVLGFYSYKTKFRIKSSITSDPTQRPEQLYMAEVDKIRSQLLPGSAARIEFDSNVPHYRTLLSSIMDWKRAVIPANPTTPGDINPDLDFFKISETGESILKKMVEVGGDPQRMVIMVGSDQVKYQVEVY